VLEGLFGEHGAVLHAALSGAQRRSLAIGENLANIDTPRYKRKSVEFESQLQRYRQSRRGWANQDLAATQPLHMGLPDLDRTQPYHMAIGPRAIDELRPVEWRSQTTSYRNDGNNVDVDYEMTLLAQNEMTYNALATFLRNKFEGLKSVIRGV
jgi:flagellar basal-body rod protein FlgB